MTYLDAKRLSGNSYDVAETPTFSDDFSSYADTTAGDLAYPTSNTAQLRVNPTTDVIDFQTAGVNTIYRDLTTVSDSAWILRYKLTYTSAGSTSLGIFYTFFSTNTSGAQTAHSGLGWFHYDNDNQGGLLTNLNTRPDQSPDSDFQRFNFSPSVSTHWIELKRVGTTTLTINVYDNANYSGTPLYTKSKTDVSASITGLRYLKFMGYTTGNMIGTIDDIKFYNGVSSLTSKPSNVQTNSIFTETDTGRTKWYNGNVWEHIAKRGVFMGGTTGTISSVMDYITIATPSNATNFGNLLVARRNSTAGVNSDTRGCYGGGIINTSTYSNIIEYITIATPSNATDFGDLTVNRYAVAGCNSDVRGVFLGGNDDTVRNVMDYITIATTGNATDFGDIIPAQYPCFGCNDLTRGIVGGGDSTFIDYITIATPSNSTDFGNLTFGKSNAGFAVNSDTRGVFALGYSTGDVQVNVIEYVTIATPSNAIDFGDLTVARANGAGVNSTTRGIFGGGDSGVVSNVIDYITIATLGNATDFGDLTVARSGLGGVNDGL